MRLYVEICGIERATLERRFRICVGEVQHLRGATLMRVYVYGRMEVISVAKTSLRMVAWLSQLRSANAVAILKTGGGVYKNHLSIKEHDMATLQHQTQSTWLCQTTMQRPR